MTEKYDIAVIGAGPGGYVAAIRAAQLGFKTVCIDKRETLGGTCLNVGCIPSKALLSSTEFLARIQQDAKKNGIEIADLKINFRQMMDRKKEIVSGLVEGVAGLFKSHQVSFKQGNASFIDAHRLKVHNEEIEADYIILATGSEPIALPGLPFDEKQVLSSTGALSLPKIPERLTVIGGGVIGVELASVYQRLGSSVTVVEMLDRICPAMDPSISRQLLKSLQKQGIHFMLSAEVITSVIQPNEVILTVQHDNRLQNMGSDVVLVSVGRRPYSFGMNLEKIGIQADGKGFIPVDGSFKTSVPHIFAIGDLIAGTMLAHRASAEGVAVVESLKGIHSVVDDMTIPNVIYTHPEVASIGMTEAEAKELSLETWTGTSYFKGNARARCMDEGEGFVKVVGDKNSGKLLGMHIIGPHASELIAEGMMALQKRATIQDIAQAPNAHPTLSEAIKEAAS
jgi:dihydrolipoamide dehydrogenase